VTSLDNLELEELVRIGVEHHIDLQWKQYDAEGDKILFEMLEKNYADFIDSLPDETVKQYALTVRSYLHFCNEVGLGNNPTGVGAVAAFLHHRRMNDVSDLKPTVAALSYWAQFRETYDATNHPLVRAIVKAAAKDNSSPDRKGH
jgi:hypothetical protein